MKLPKASNTRASQFIIILLLTTIILADVDTKFVKQNCDIENHTTNCDFIKQNESEKYYDEACEDYEDDEDDNEHTILSRLHMPDLGILGSFQNVTFWAAKEEMVYKAVKERLNYLQQEVDFMNNFVEDYEKSTGEVMKHLYEPKPTSKQRANVVASSAVLTLLMSHRYSSSLHDLRKLKRSYGYLNSADKVNEALETKLDDRTQQQPLQFRIVPLQTAELLNQRIRRWPGNIEYIASKMDVERLHDFYGFQPKQLRIGLEVDSAYGGELNAYQCYQLGKIALNLTHYYAAIEWLELAKNLSTSHEKDRSIDIHRVSSLLNETIQIHNLKFRKALQYKGADIWSKLLNFFHKETYEGESGRIRARRIWHKNFAGVKPYNDPLANFWGLCSGSNYQPSSIQAQLKCYFKMTNPYFQLVPLKTEELSLDPLILQMYDVLSESQIEGLQLASKDNLEKSVVFTEKGLNLPSLVRTSSGAWLQHKDFPELINKAELMTDLKIWTTAEEIQIADYVPGRHYIHHRDNIIKPHLLIPPIPAGATHGGERMVTMLYYLDVPKYGGGTVFVDAGVTSNPIKGSAIFWYNVKRNGSPVYSTTHGACPIIHGTKSIASIWIRYDGNWEKYRCSLNPLE